MAKTVSDYKLVGVGGVVVAFRSPLPILRPKDPKSQMFQASQTAAKYKHVAIYFATEIKDQEVQGSCVPSEVSFVNAFSVILPIHGLRSRCLFLASSGQILSNLLTGAILDAASSLLVLIRGPGLLNTFPAYSYFRG